MNQRKIKYIIIAMLLMFIAFQGYVFYSLYKINVRRSEIIAEIKVTCEQMRKNNIELERQTVRIRKAVDRIKKQLAEREK